MVHWGEDFAGMKWPKCRQDKQYMHVGMWQLETWVCGGLGGAVDLMILESFLQLKWFCDSASEFNWWSWSVDKTAEWDKTVFFCPLMFYEVNILYPLTWMAELLYSSTYLTALWWEHQPCLYHQFSSAALIIKWRCLWVTENSMGKACIETSIWRKMSSEWKWSFCGFVWILTYLYLEKDLFVVPFCFARKKLVKIIWKLVL